MKPVIGILGGMGPRATVAFERLLIAQINGADQDIPTIITINDGGIPDRSQFISGYGPDPVPQLQRNLDMLEQMGATVICLPCNTAAAPIIRDRLRTFSSRLLDLPQLTGDELVTAGVSRIFILGTAGTIEAETYQKVCRERGIKYLLPDFRCQKLTDKLINAIKCQDMPAANFLAQKIMRRVRLSSCESVLLGCTELSLVKDQLVPPNCLAIDTIAILADACVSYSQNHIQGETF